MTGRIDLATTLPRYLHIASQRLGTGTQANARAQEEAEARPGRALVLELGIVVWPSFTLLDLYMAIVVFPDARLWPLLSLRVLGLAILAATWWVVVRSRLSATHSAHVFDAALVSLCACISVMAVGLGGVGSSYMHGVSVVLITAAVIPARAARAARALIPAALAFPFTMAVAAAFDPAVASTWRDLHALAPIGAEYLFVVSAALVGAWCAHAMWKSRQQLFKARRLSSGRYRLHSCIGEGGMSYVWLAWDEQLLRDVALKILRVGSDVDDYDIARFEREALAASRLQSPHSVRVFDFGASDDGIWFIAMEYLAGADLHRVLRRSGPMSADRVVRLGVQICEAISEAHARGIVHRDIKPSNLFVTVGQGEHEHLRVLDFGVSRVLDSTRDTLRTDTGEFVGTVAYSAPECLLGSPADAASDIYSIGATLYEMLTGKNPFEGRTGLQLAAAHVAIEPTPPSRVRGSAVPRELDEIVLRCLRKSPDERFASVRELSIALEAVGATPALRVVA